MDPADLVLHPLLREIPPERLAGIAGRCRRMTVASRSVLLVKGQQTEELYFLLSGRLRVAFDSKDAPNGIQIGPGEIVGEMSIIEGKPVSAWVVAEEPCELLAMPQDVFWGEYLAVAEANRRLMQFLISRVRSTSAMLQAEFERKVRYEILQKELESAAKIQASLLPAGKPLLKNPAVELHALMRPAREVGGDFYDALPVDETTVCGSIGDVSGKGMPAALFMVRVITLLRSALLESKSPEEVLPRINRQLCEGNEEFMFVTLAVVVLDTRNGKVAYLNAGHNPPALSRGGGPFEIWTPPKGALLGVAPKAAYSVGLLQLERGDRLLLYTDGVTEAENEAKEIYGVPRLLEALQTEGNAASVERLVGRIEDDVAAFVGSASQSDDITMLGLRWLGPS